MMSWLVPRIATCVLMLCAAGMTHPDAGAPPVVAPTLRLEQIGADSTGFNAVATLVIGPRHVLLWDAQYHKADAERVADAIARSGKPLQAIIISHPDEDHYSGVAAIVARFPGTPVLMTPTALALFDSMAPPRFRSDRARQPTLFADSLIRPTTLPSTRIDLDGATLEVLTDLQGDVRRPSNSVLWIPSQRILLAGDLVFNGVFPWLGSSDSASRAGWRRALQRLTDLRPSTVVAGHKASITLPDSPTQLAAMDRYLADFDSLRQRVAGPAALRDAILARYPAYTVRMLLSASAGAAYRGTTAAAPAPTPTPTPPPASSSVGPSVLRPGRWTGSLVTPGGSFVVEFTVGSTAGRSTLQLKPDGLPPREATDLRYDGSALTFGLMAGDRAVQCTLQWNAERSLEGSCGEEAGKPGPIRIRMTPPE